MAEIILLGTGTGVPSLKRAGSSCLLSLGDSRILVDIGQGVLRRLLEAGLTCKDIDLILITHTHPDHVADLVPFLFGAKYFSDPRRKDLYLGGGWGLRGFVEDLNRVFGGSLLPDLYRLRIKEMGRRSLWHWKGISIESFPVRHRDNSRGYRIRGGGKDIAFSGDAGYSDDLVLLAKGADTFICEASLPEGMEVEGHLTPSLAGRVAREAGVRRLILTHFYPEVEGESLLDRVRENFSGEVIVGEDLLKIPL